MKRHSKPAAVLSPFRTFCLVAAFGAMCVAFSAGSVAGGPVDNQPAACTADFGQSDVPGIDGLSVAPWWPGPVFGPEGPGGGTLCAPNLDDTEVYGSSDSDAPRDGGPGCGTAAADGAGGTTDAPLHFTGVVAERPVDFHLPSRGLSVEIRRIYNQRVDADGSGVDSDVATELGFNWTMSYRERLIDLTGGAYLYLADLARSYTYSISTPDVFVDEDDMRILSRLRLDGESGNTFTMQKPDGTRWIFHDFTHGTTALRGRLWKIEGLYASNVITITYNTDGTIDYITDPSGHYFRFGYVTSGTLTGKLKEIDVWEDSTTNDSTKKIARLEYTQKDGNTTSHADCGSDGDLILVKVMVRDSNDTSTLGMSRQTHYRYFKGAYSTNSYNGQSGQIRHIYRPQDMQRAEQDVGVGNVLTASNATIASYLSNSFEYKDTDNGRVKTETVYSAAGTSCCGGGAGAVPGTYVYTYSTNTPSGRNDWALQMKETRPDGSVRYIETNAYGEVTLLAHFEDDGDSNAWNQVWGFQRDTTSGRVTHVYSPTAIKFDPSPRALTYDADGLVYYYAYENESKEYRYKYSKRCKYSETDNPGSGEPSTTDGEMIESIDWDATTGWSYRSTVWPTARYTYPEATGDPAAASKVATHSYAYRRYLDGANVTDRIKVLKTTFTSVPTTENGSGVSTVTYLYFDEDGEVRWSKNGEGRVAYYASDIRNGRTAIMVADVYTGTTEGSIAPSEITAPASNVKDWTGAAPIETTGSPTYDFQTTGSSADYVQLTTKWSFDTRGRIRSVTTPDNQVSYLAYLNNEYRVYPSWDSTNGEPRLPMQRVITDYTTTNRRVSVETVNGKNVSDFASTPNGVETWPSYTDWVAWNRTIFNADGRPAEVWVYKAIPSGLGTENTDYFKTSFAYETLDDSPSGEGKGSVVEVRDAEGGWSKTVLNVAGEPIATYQTATEAGTPPAATNYRLTSEMFYGQATPGTGVSLGGDLTASRSYFGTGSSDYNQDEFLYDWRRDLKVIRHEDSSASEAPPHTVIDYDAMGREIATATYTSASGLSASSTTSTTTNRASLSETSYDKLGRVYSTKTYSLNTNGTTDGNVLLTRVFYDRNHQVVAVDPPNGGVVISKPDGAGRMVESWVCSEMEHTAAEVYTGTGAFDYTSGDIKIIEKTALTLNKASAATIIAHHELNHDDTNGMASGTSDSVATYTLNFFDAAGRLSDTAFYGTNTTAWAGASAPSYGSVPSRSDSILVTSYGYDAASSRITSVTDPKAIVSEYAYNALGQVTLVTESKGVGGSDLNRKTAYDYDYIGNVKKIYAKEVANYDASGGNDDQITEYVREDTTDTSWVTQIRYPMPSTGAPAGSSDYNDMVRLEYNIDGTIKTRTDQIGNVIGFDYDKLRRLTDQRVTTLAGYTDGVTRRISYTYANTGRLQKVTSHDATTGGDVNNEVELSYNGYGALSKDAQSHEDEVDGSTPAVEYAYGHSDSTDQTSSQNYFSRLKNIKYPNGRYAWYDYGHSTSGIATMNHLLSRVSRIADGDSSAASKVLAEYSFNGLGRMVQRDHVDLGSGSVGKPGNKTALRFIRQGGSGDMYPDFDRFGRVTAVRHLNYTGTTADSTSAATVAHFGYGYDRNSNRTYAETLHNIGRSRYFTYDNLNRLTSDKIGLLNSGKTDLTDEWAKPGEDTWSLDILGNWTAQDKRSTDTAASETRSHNATNEISSRTVVAEAARFSIGENFDDNDETHWTLADIASGSDGSWDATSAKMQCDTVVTVSGAPGGSGSLFFVDAGTYQDFQIGAAATVPDTGSHIGGLVFGYQDPSNFWMLIINRQTDKTELYQVLAGAYTLRTSKAIAFGGSDTLDLYCEVRSGFIESMPNGMSDYTATVPAGKVGLWAGTGSSNVKFDNFKVLSLAENAEIDGRWYSNVGGVSVNTSTGKLDCATSSTVATAGVAAEKLAVRRGFRGGKYILEVDSPIATNDAVGVVLHYQRPPRTTCCSSLARAAPRLRRCSSNAKAAPIRRRRAERRSRWPAVTRCAASSPMTPETQRSRN